MSDRLAFFVQDLRGGGAERAVVRLVNGIAARNIATDLVLISRRGPFLPDLAPDVNVFELPQKRTATSILGLRGYLSRRRPKSLVAHMTHTNVAAIAARALSSHRPRLLVVEHNRFDVARARRRGLPRLAYNLVPFAYRYADAVAVVAEGMRARLAEESGLSGTKILVLQNPVISPDLFTQAALDPQHPWFGPGQPPVVLAVGRLNRQKNYPLLLEAFARLRKLRPARLLILGEGDERSALEAIVAKNGLETDVALPGFLPNPFAYMSRAGVYAMSSDWEGLPTVLIEALACGPPVVSTDCESGPSEILMGGRYGRLVPTGDAQAFADALAAALRDPGDRNIRLTRAMDFGLDKAVDAYLNASGFA